MKFGKKDGTRKLKISNLMLINLILLAFITFLLKVEIDSKAKFLTESVFNGTQAVVAAFRYGVSNYTTTSGTINLKQTTKNTSFSFTISNNNGDTSNVALNYGIIITFPSELKDSLDNGYISISSIKIDNVDVDLSSKLSKSNNNLTYTYSNLGTFEAGVTKNVNCNVTIFATTQSVKVSNKTINIKTYFEQID